MASINVCEYNLPPDLPGIPDGWSYVRLMDLVNAERGISYGIVQPGSHALGGVPIVRVNNVRDGRIETDDALHVARDIEAKYTRTRLVGGEVLLTLVGSIGASAVVSEQLIGWNVARAVAVIPVRSEIGSRWVALCLRSSTSQHYMRTWATTTVQATLNLRDVAKLPIPMPLPRVREAIVHILGTLDDKIELNRRMNETLEAIARAIFKSWFVDFDPVIDNALKAGSPIPDEFADRAQRRKEALTRNGRDDAKTPTLDPKTASLFPDTFTDSPLGPIPSGWRVATIADLARYVNGRNFTKNATGTGRMVIRIAELRSGPGGSTVYNEVDANDENTAFPDNILFAWSGSLDVYRWHLDEAIINQHIFKVICENYPEWFVYHHLRETMPFFQAIASHKATTMGHIKRGHLSEVNVTIPPEGLLDGVARVIEPAYAKVHAMKQESRTLAAIRDALLPKLLSGEIRVKDAERIAEEVA